MPLLEVKNLSISFHTRNGVIKAVDNLSFTLIAGETLGIVGESGSGKSVCCYSLLGLIPQPPGRIESGSAIFEGRDLLRMSPTEQRHIRGNQIAMIFQDPMTCLNPYLTIGEQLIEPLIYHRQQSRVQARTRAIELLGEVGIRDPEMLFDAYPHQFSGGMRQRVMIAMALIDEPKLLIADEPTTALDVTIQKQILELIDQLRRKRNLTVIFISHDLAVVASVANRVIVMKSGVAVEQGAVRELFANPQHDYTRKLLAAIPKGPKTVASISAAEPLLSVKNVTTSFARFKAVDNISFDLQRGEVLGLVGESGSGKSTLGRSLLNLITPSGSIKFAGEELIGKDNAQMKPWRRRMQMIFQDPYASLNPRMTIYDTLKEPMLLHGVANKSTVDQAVLELMDEVGLDRAYVRKYPHEFSGGQRQRIAIARAIATKPEFIVADEPVSALDVTIQKQIIELLLTLVAKHNLSMLFISHDLAVVRLLCDRVMIIQRGQLLEHGPTEQVWSQPFADYTRNLLAAASV
jgi:oligopeptide transport system ATP-binding protein